MKLVMHVFEAGYVALQWSQWDFSDTLMQDCSTQIAIICQSMDGCSYNLPSVTDWIIWQQLT